VKDARQITAVAAPAAPTRRLRRRREDIIPKPPRRPSVPRRQMPAEPRILHDHNFRLARGVTWLEPTLSVEWSIAKSCSWRGSCAIRCIGGSF